MEIIDFLKMKFDKFCKSLDDFDLVPSRKIVKDYDNPKNVNSEMCARCGGFCCRNCGCHFSPDDFKEISFEYLKKQLEKGYISIDYIDEEICYLYTGMYILRVRNIGAPVVDVEARHSAPCRLLTPKGCKLPYKKRPSGARLLIPNVDPYDNSLHCIQNYNIRDCAYEWSKYQGVLLNLVEYFKDKDVPCSL